jgi:hypothetical protein
VTTVPKRWAKSREQVGSEEKKETTMIRFLKQGTPLKLFVNRVFFKVDFEAYF